MPPIFVIPFPDINPVAVSLGPFAIRWYALAYIAGLVIGWRYCLALAGRLFDGVILHPFLTTKAVGDSVALVRRAAEEAGRDPASVRVVTTLVSAPDLSPELTLPPVPTEEADPPEVAYLLRRRRGLTAVLALAAALAAFAAGYGFGHSKGKPNAFTAVRNVAMHGTTNHSHSGENHLAKGSPIRFRNSCAARISGMRTDVFLIQNQMKSGTNHSPPPSRVQSE